jgi:RNA polymerase sigma-70 factor (ECF subfamily)
MMATVPLEPRGLAAMTSDDRSMPPAVDVDPAFAELYLADFRRVAGLVQSLVGGRDVADEITQDAFVIAHARWHRISQYDRPQDYVRRVALNRAVSTLRRRGAERRALDRLQARGGPVADQVVAVDGADAAPLWAKVRALPPRQAQVIALTYVEDLGVEQVAAVLGCSVSSVKTHLRRGRATLAAALAAEPEDVR